MNYSPLLAFLVTLLMTTWLLSNKLTKGVQDIPNERSLHKSPVPRIGGIGLVSGVLSGWLVEIYVPSLSVLISFLVLFLLSIFDDVRGLSVRIRFSLHFVAAISVVWGAGLFFANVLLAVLAVFTIVWMTNLYNFMDGSDGLAGGMTLFGFVAYGIAALMGGDELLAMTCFSISAAALGFLYFNFYPAKIFMGDAGSIPLGFLAASIGIVGWNENLWPAWFPAMVFSPFIFDATMTLFKRVLRGEKVWQAHREHYYQRLVQLGFGHRNTALLEYALMIAVGISALWLLRNPNILFDITSIWVLIYVVLMAKIDSLWAAKQRA
jgi:UDP-N-acetylmuramyl pentapeptide phosphotransferase/UDP-N-acetylglucosamine-1-phosphate transferase